MNSSRVVTFDGKHEPGAAIALTVLRVGVGVIMAVHGWSKLSDIAGTSQSFAHLGMPAPQFMVYLAIAGEFLGGLGLVAGLLTRIAALGPVCTMLVAIVTVHIGHGLLSKNGGFEYPLVLLLVSGFFALNGPGPWSLDAWLKQRVERDPLAPWHGSVRDQIPNRP
ncbi:MAG TPA: DoxX family protein [Polyangiaceae bacterium]|jgi:putative oxidoreductase|nr:DoxX family protein [Polyangiaceae bacterium]